MPLAFCGFFAYGPLPWQAHINDYLHRYITEISDHLYVITNGKAYLTNGIEDLKTLGYIH